MIDEIEIVSNVVCMRASLSPLAPRNYPRVGDVANLTALWDGCEERTRRKCSIVFFRDRCVPNYEQLLIARSRFGLFISARSSRRIVDRGVRNLGWHCEDLVREIPANTFPSPKSRRS